MALPENSTPTESTPEEWLLAAVRAKDAAHRERYAERGLSFEDINSDTRLLLLRQRYVAALDRGELEAALAIAGRMIAVGAMIDVAHHDRARVLLALGRDRDALHAQRLSARTAPAQRRSFQLWSLATLEHRIHDAEGALRTLTRALRVAVRDRPLIKAHAAFIRLDTGRAVRSLEEIVEALATSKNAEGYGQFLLGMIAFHRDAHDAARLHLTTFLARNVDADAAKRLTLEDELARARRTIDAMQAEG